MKDTGTSAGASEGDGAKPYRPSHIPALDGVRGLAVLTVFLFHYGGGTHSSFAPMRIFGILNKGGWSGVILFFVLSGFLITGILWDSFDDPQWWRKFFARRSLRIFPLYYLVLALLLAAAFAAHTGWPAWRRLWIPALFLEDLPWFESVAGSISSPLSIFHLWSIAVEEQFYLLWPWLLLLFARRRIPAAREHAKLLCGAIFLVSFVFRVLVWTLAARPALWEHFLLTQAGALAAGGWLALAVRGREWPRVLRAAPVVLGAALVAVAVSGLLSHTLESSGRYMMTGGLPALTLFFAALIALALRPGVPARLFSMGWLRSLGNLSYGIYVFHMLFLVWIVALTQRLAGHRGLMVQNAVQFLVAASVTLLAAWLSWHLFEKQFLRLKGRFVPRVPK